MVYPRMFLLATALVAGCGEAPENQPAAINDAGPPQGDEMVLIPNGHANGEPTWSDANGALRMRIEDIEGGAGLEERVPIPQTGDENRDSIVIDAAPNDLIDSAQGFAPEPIDDASGLDPSPSQDNDWGE